nr:hypothetical protein B0A51_16783 [Rachicladosporium sp. CCFEE 5018]
MAHSNFQQSIVAMANAPAQLYQNAKATGLRKRNSLFSRPETRTELGTARETSGDSQTMNTPPDHVRPSTSHQERSRNNTFSYARERSNTGPSGNKRQSLFSGRKMSLRRGTPSASPAIVEEDSESTFGSLAPRHNFNSDDEYYHYLRKTSISPPFNFQHVTHTHRQHLPDLATVVEKQLTREFWANSAYQSPRRQLNGIKADSVFKKLEVMGVPRGAPSSRPVTPSALESAALQGSRMSSKQSPPLPQHPTRHPRRTTSINALSGVDAAGIATAKPLPTEAAVHPALRTSRTSPATSRRGTMSPTPGESSRVPAAPSGIEHRSKQPLPALPPPGQTSRAQSRQSMSRKTSDRSEASGPVKEDAKARRANHRASGAVWNAAPMYGASGLRTQSSLSMHSNWEDDVDFCYEQAAESTCHFDWDAGEGVPRPSSHESEDLAPPMRITTGSQLSLAISANSGASERRSSTGVGHRGFLQARQSLVLDTANTTRPSSEHRHSASLPVLSTPDLGKPLVSPNMLSIPNLDRFSTDSYYQSIKRASRVDSAGPLHGSSGEPYDTTTKPPATLQSSRQSNASLSSVPGLLHGSKATPSLDEVPEPDTPTQDQDINTSETDSVSDLMRKPSTMSNRALLQAGREVQRKRPGQRGSQGSGLKHSSPVRQSYVAQNEGAWI